MLTLESLSCRKAPALEGLSLAIAPGELPVVVAADDAEREALVELLAGARSESAGQVLLDGKRLTPAARRREVVVLPQRAALSPALTVGEQIQLVAQLRGLSLVREGVDRLLQFARIDRAARRPNELTAESQLRLTLALASVGHPALVIALDPAPEVAALLPELRAADRALLGVTRALGGLDAQATRLHVLRQGRLAEGLQAVPAAQTVRRFRLRLGPGVASPVALLATQAGVVIDALPGGDYLLRVQEEVALAPLLRLLVQGGVAVEGFAEESGPAAAGEDGR